MPEGGTLILGVEETTVLVVEVVPLSPERKSARSKNEAYLRQADGDYPMNDNDLRMGGLYAMGLLPEAVFLSLAATAAVRVSRDGSGVRTRNLKEFGGPIPLLLDETMEWVRDNLAEERAYTADGHMESRPELPMSAVRELLAHAFVHRDLGPNTVGTGKRVEIRVLRDRLIIKSPGGLKGLSTAQLESTDLKKSEVFLRSITLCGGGEARPTLFLTMAWSLA